MRIAALITIFGIFPSIAMAQAVPVPAPYTPVTISRQDYDALTKYLSAQPYSFAAPIMSYLQQREAQASAASRKSTPKTKAPNPVDAKSNLPQPEHNPPPQ